MGFRDRSVKVHQINEIKDSQKLRTFGPPSWNQGISKGISESARQFSGKRQIQNAPAQSEDAYIYKTDICKTQNPW